MFESIQLIDCAKKIKHSMLYFQGGEINLWSWPLESGYKMILLILGVKNGGEFRCILFWLHFGLLKYITEVAQIVLEGLQRPPGHGHTALGVHAGAGVGTDEPGRPCWPQPY